MDALIKNGDFALDQGKRPMAIKGIEELIQRALFRLMIPKGSFELDKSLGSELYRLKYAINGDIDEEAAVLAEKALSDMPEAVVYNIKCSMPREGVLKMDFTLSVNNLEGSKEIDTEALL
jgi:hypothetical protein